MFEDPILTLPEAVTSERKANILASPHPLALTISSVFFFFFFFFVMAAPATYGHSLARGLIRAAAAGLHRHRNTGSEPHLQPTSKPAATLDP